MNKIDNHIDEFQSTPSVGRATPLKKFRVEGNRFQSTPSVGRATNQLLNKINNHIISIHALRGEGDLNAEVSYSDGLVFQSTPSVGRATYDHVAQ